jgi:chromosome segregation protein
VLDLAEALLGQDGDAVSREQLDVEEELARLARRRQVLDAQLVDSSGAVARATQAHEAAQEALTQLRVDVASGRERVEQAAAALAHLGQLATHLAGQLDEKSARRTWLAAQQERVRDDGGRLADERRAVTAALESLRERHRGALAAAGQRETVLRSRQEEEREQRRRLTAQQAAVVEGAQRLAELGHQIDRIADYLATVYQLSPEHALAAAGPLPALPEGDAAAEAERQIAALKARREQMGPVNPAAIDDYQELHQRYEFLTKQEADLAQSIDDLRAAIAKINRTTKALFLETFARVNQQFGELFARFFEGGEATLTLLDEENPLESGIEIMAQPPGKRLRTIQLLSGGEKALTAIALLMASFLIAPNPFCLLDEIDAPLDEENIRRYTTVLKSMVRQTQFLVVTHNKRTMEIADQLYGVTMEEPGVSRLIGVRLEAAEQLAAVSA